MGWGEKMNGKESVATMWARMVREAEAGEVIAIQNKHGKDVAVMMSTEKYDWLIAEIERLSGEGG